MRKGRLLGWLTLAFAVLIPTGIRAESKEALHLNAIAMNVTGMRSGLTRLTSGRTAKVKGSSPLPRGFASTRRSA
jgi:hypothetical protein